MTWERSSETQAVADPRRRYFTVGQANQALVLVAPIVTDIQQTYCKATVLFERCKALRQRGQTGEALDAARDEYAAAREVLGRLSAELTQIGCELRDIGRGLVEFPSNIDGRVIFLCWTAEQTDVTMFRELHESIGDQHALPDHVLSARRGV